MINVRGEKNKNTLMNLSSYRKLYVYAHGTHAEQSRQTIVNVSLNYYERRKLVRYYNDNNHNFSIHNTNNQHSMLLDPNFMELKVPHHLLHSIVKGTGSIKYPIIYDQYIPQIYYLDHLRFNLDPVEIKCEFPKEGDYMLNLICF